MYLYRRLFCVVITVFLLSGCTDTVRAATRDPFDDFQARTPIHITGPGISSLSSADPTKIRKAYNLPSSGGSGIIAIVDAYNDPTIEADLAIFDKKFKVPGCSTANGCFTKHLMSSNIKADQGWAVETALDVEWAHAIAPNAQILLVEAISPGGADLLSAVDYASSKSGVSAVSMSWGGGEFSTESTRDNHFTNNQGTVFFASSGDSGAGVSWPAVSKNVVGVGGTTLHFSNGAVSSETAWSGSGGGLSSFELQPSFQSAYAVPKANGKRAVPDVAYNADPKSGYKIYTSTNSSGSTGWMVVGGTSAGTPQWAAIHTLGSHVDNPSFYHDAAGSKYGSFFRDIIKGKNGTCGFYCTAGKNYDYVTGLGSPLKVSF